MLDKISEYEASKKLYNFSSNSAYRSNSISSKTPCGPAKIQAMCFSVSIGEYCFCFNISNNLDPLVS